MTTFIRPTFSPWHIPPLFIATTFTFGGILPFYRPARAIQEFGLPAHIVASREAHSTFAIYGSRMSMLGLLIYSSYFRSDFKTLDTILQLLVIAGTADGWICWKEGATQKAIGRFLAGVAFGVYGFFGLTWRRN
ncbi:hypothetical protein HJFPF1_09547 [Paramyrothecium foliicola]|nr:hypothetical protein HJFPF1_09547 [Paramyrothecium foliicola]